MRLNANVSRSFSSFINGHEDYTTAQKREIVTLFRQSRVRRIVMLSLYLFLWSIAGVILDALFVGGGIVTALMMQHLMLAFFMPAIIFFVINSLVKFVFIKVYMKNDIGLGIAALVTLPYIGSAILFGALLRKHPLFLKALNAYIKHLRKQGIVATWKLCFEGDETSPGT